VLELLAVWVVVGLWGASHHHPPHPPPPFGGEDVYDEQNGHNPALAELGGRLQEGLGSGRLSKSDLARRAGLGPTTVSEAFQSDGPVPSAGTVTALARALRLPAEELLKLRRAAAGGGGAGRPGPGRAIREWEPHDLEVHPAGHMLGQLHHCLQNHEFFDEGIAFPPQLLSAA
ncbi:helix-turn-helix domain-containing protein, partial [Streptomyces sp. NPDC059766]|uniref:helix-turn-helix domain-containing protein n=1 Tax=Streptomyces sp. NPDC059766 TaxID=3346940 RepID=UPI003648879B